MEKMTKKLDKNSAIFIKCGERFWYKLWLDSGLQSGIFLMKIEIKIC